LRRWLGAWILRIAPKFMKSLSVLGTAAMFLVGGGILVHGIPAVADLLHHVEALAQALPVASGLAGVIAAMLYNGIFGIIAGGLLVVAGAGLKRLWPGKSHAGLDKPTPPRPDSGS
jgi:predicted DNA repair protein MutK